MTKTHVLYFGKHKGELLTTVPTRYLRWLQGLDNLDAALARAVKAELSSRGERYLPAAVVLDDIEDAIVEVLSRQWAVGDNEAAVMGDVVMEAFDDVRKKHKIGRQTQLVVPATRQARVTDGW